MVPVRAHFKIVFGAAAGLAAGIITPAMWQLAILVGWIVGTAVILIWIWAEIGGLDAARTAAVATREDASREISRLLLLGASVVSLAAVVAAFHRAKAGQPHTFLLLGVAMVAIVLAWLTVHTVFTLHYAHYYYQDPPGGVEFPGLTTGPCYRDFAYLAFTIGMTFQVSDTAIHDSSIRHMVLSHALLSYLFGTAIFAGAINMLAGFIG
jgi:uncharacterized membrane protein